MVLGPRWLAFALLVTSLAWLTGCQRVTASQNTQTVAISMNVDGTCTQNGSSGVIELAPAQPVMYQGAANSTQFQIQFTSCPFSSCPVSSPNGMAVNVGAPTGTPGTTYNISSMTINNQACKGVGSMSVKIKGGP